MKKLLIATMTLCLVASLAHAKSTNNEQAALSQLHQQIQTVQTRTMKQMTSSEKVLTQYINEQIKALEKAQKQQATINQKNISTLEGMVEKSHAALEKQIKALEKQVIGLNQTLQKLPVKN